jgi:hypothetical protein
MIKNINTQQHLEKVNCYFVSKSDKECKKSVYILYVKAVSLNVYYLGM